MISEAELAALRAAASVEPRAASYAAPALVVRVIDGDTAVCAFAAPARDGTAGPIVVESVRFAGVDTPELRGGDEHSRARARAARDAVQGWMEGRVVRLEFGAKVRDKYGRFLARPLVPLRRADTRDCMAADECARAHPAAFLDVSRALIDDQLGVPY